MGHLFLDIETYAALGNPDSALNPYHPESKVLVVSYNYYNGFKPPVKEKLQKPTFLVEWESDEKMILATFYLFLKEIQANDTYLKITGFNILKFDLPYLYGRMKAHKIAPEKELHDLLFRPFGVDLFQISAVLPEKTLEFEQLWGMNHKDVSKKFNLQVKEGTGLDCSRFYDAKEYDKIMKYCTEEFNFEQMMTAFYDHIAKR